MDPEIKHINRISKQVISCLLGITLLLVGNAFAAHTSGCPNPAAFPFNDCHLSDDVRQGSYAYFDQGVKVKYKAKKKKKGGDNFNLKTKYNNNSNRSQFLVDLDNTYHIDRTKYILKLKVRNGIASGSVVIKGLIKERGMTRRNKLMTARLEGAWTLSEDGRLLGMNTTDIVCHEVLQVICTESESIYLVLDDAINTGKKKIKTTGVAVTTTPLPATAWLFGSGVLCLAGIARKHKLMI